MAFPACGSTPPSPPTINPPGAERINGSERVAWNQDAADAGELAAIGYVMYVDGQRTILGSATCDTTTEVAGFPCRSPLPPLTPGAHTLELASFVNDGGSTLESAKSPALAVIVTPASGIAAPAPIDTIFSTSDRVSLRMTTVATGLDDPTDLAILPDGRIAIVERAGRVRWVRDNDVTDAPLQLDDVASGAGDGVLGAAIDPEFDRTHAFFIIYIAAARGGRTFRVIRLRELNGTLADAVAVFEGGAPSSRPAAVVRFGPDGKLYLALDDGGVPQSAGSLSSLAGKVLRLNIDGTTPVDQAAGTPTFSLPYRSPAGLDWQAGSDLLWIADAVRPRTTVFSAVRSADPLRQRATTVFRYVPAPSLSAAGMIFYNGPVAGLAGNLLVAGGDSGQIRRLRFDPRTPGRVASGEDLLPESIGNVQSIAAARDGTVYFTSAGMLLAIRPTDAAASRRQ